VSCVSRKVIREWRASRLWLWEITPLGRGGTSRHVRGAAPDHEGAPLARVRIHSLIGRRPDRAGERGKAGVPAAARARGGSCIRGHAGGRIRGPCGRGRLSFRLPSASGTWKRLSREGCEDAKGARSGRAEERRSGRADERTSGRAEERTSGGAGRAEDARMRGCEDARMRGCEGRGGAEDADGRVLFCSPRPPPEARGKRMHGCTATVGKRDHSSENGGYSSWSRSRYASTRVFHRSTPTPKS
jgi:hypothetical protein